MSYKFYPIVRKNNTLDLFDMDFDDLFRPFSGGKGVMPYIKTDISENENSYVLEMDIPGFKKEEIKIDLEKGYLTVTATKEDNKEEKEGKYIRRERVYGGASRSFYVGDINESMIKAEYTNGTLNIELPKEEQQKAIQKRSITIN